jgi:GDP-L-fucose synthase
VDNKLTSGSRIYVAGHSGMVGSAIVRELRSRGFLNLIEVSSSSLDLRNQESVENFFSTHRPEYVFVAAAHVGGIFANDNYPAEFIYDNLMIASNVIHSSWKMEVKKLLFLGSSCIYPKFAEQPIREDSLLSGYLESTNEAYAIAKIAGVKMCEYYNKQYGCNFISAMPTNLYGYGDNYHPQNSHVLPALIRRFHEAKTEGKSSVTVWGSGKQLREFMFADDLARACVFIMENYHDRQLINIGTGEEISISDLANKVASIVKFEGSVDFDASKPEGTPRKLLDSSKLRGLGFNSRTPLEEGIKLTYLDFLKRSQTIYS